VRAQRAAGRRAHRERHRRQRDEQDHDVRAERISCIRGRVAEDRRCDDADETGDAAHDEQRARQP